VYDAQAMIRMVQLRREAEAEAERRYNAVSEPVRRARSSQFSQRMHEVVERRQTPSQLSLPGIKPTLMALRYPGLMTQADAIASGLAMPMGSAPLVSPWGGQQLELSLGQSARQVAASAAPESKKAPPPRKDTVLRQLRAMASEPGPDLPPPAPEPVRFRVTPEEMRLAGQMFMPAGSGGGGAPPVVPPGGMFPAQAPLPSGRPRTAQAMAGPRMAGIFGLGLATLGGIAGAIAQADTEDNVMSSEVATSAALGLGGAGLLGAAAMRAPADNYLIRRRR